MRACQSDTDGSILYDHATYEVLLIKVKIVLNTEVESSMTSLASKTHFKVLSLGPVADLEGDASPPPA